MAKAERLAKVIHAGPSNIYDSHQEAFRAVAEGFEGQSLKPEERHTKNLIDMFLPGEHLRKRIIALFMSVCRRFCIADIRVGEHRVRGIRFPEVGENELRIGKVCFLKVRSANVCVG